MHSCHTSPTPIRSPGLAWAFRALAGISLCSVVAGATAAETAWSRIETAAQGRTEAIGGPSNGCLRGALSLPASGEGFVSIRRHRNRYYGHASTIAFVRELAASVSEHSGGRLMMVGDLAQPRGGRMASSHVSHQNGLDVDIWLTLADSSQQAWRDTPEERDPPSVLGPGLEPNAYWSLEQRFLIKTAAEHRDVDRILVNPGIKRALCRSEGEAPWLRKLRPWWGHNAHIHVRLRCPPGSPDCVQQGPIPAGSGCGAELAWWFSEEARSPSRGAASKPRPRPEPPAACMAVLDET